MRGLNLTFPGGMPLVQETLNHMQNSYFDLAKAMGRMGLDGSAFPVIVSGVIATGTVYTDGWIYYNDDIIYFPGGDTAGGMTKIKLQVLTSSVVYEDLSVNPLYYGNSLILCNALDLDAVCLLTECVRMPVGFGAYTEDYSDLLTIAVPSVGIGASGNIYLRINELSKTVHIWGSISLTAAQSIANPPQYKQLATGIAVNHRPATDVPFQMLIRYHTANYIQEANTTEHITHLNAELTAGGDLNVGFIKPQAAITAYTVVVNTLLPLK